MYHQPKSPRSEPMLAPSPSSAVPLYHYGKATDHITYAPLYADQSPHAYGNPRPPSTPRRGRLLDWGTEIIAWIISFAGTAAVIIVLRMYNDRPLSDWPHGIAFNAVISILALVYKASLLAVTASCISQLKWTRFAKRERNLIELDLFDAASRGARGSLRMIFTPALWHLALLGAVVTVVAVAVGPFTQQAITYPLRTVDVSRATIPRTQTYQNIAPGGIQALKDIPLTMKAAAYNGLFAATSAQTRSTLPAQCSTGNCTFPPYSSLAICTKCANITQMVARNDCSVVPPFGTQCTNYTLPNDLVLNGHGELINSSTSTLSNTKILDSYGSNLANISFLLSQSAIASTPDDIRAYECSIYFCLQKYQSSFNNGDSDRQYMPDIPGSAYSAVDHNITAPPGFVAANEQANFSVGEYSFGAVGHYLGTLLTGYASGDIGEASYTSDAINAIYNSLSSDSNGTSIIQALATSMTADLRTNSGAQFNIAVAPGTATQDVTYIHVRWIWLALPLTLQALGVLLLGITITLSLRNRTPVWKSSLLAALFLGPSSNAPGRPGLQHSVPAFSNNIPFAVPTQKEMEERARTMRVRLSPDESGGLRLQ
ncbi:hypothetical protein H2200_013282 [Cladophialophora chaetospira]|uniref:Uncharacterized protein n=1 Tax=Cladophialophora chaetospira TaxID=386627 RepID=A0AA38UE32_9EURO|nr:hypothetical protein H2200_013282 [Cladophialophora chaetospira]